MKKTSGQSEVYEQQLHILCVIINPVASTDKSKAQERCMFPVYHLSTVMLVFLKKTQTLYLQIFLTLF